MYWKVIYGPDIFEFWKNWSRYCVLKMNGLYIIVRYITKALHKIPLKYFATKIRIEAQPRYVVLWRPTFFRRIFQGLTLIHQRSDVRSFNMVVKDCSCTKKWFNVLHNFCLNIFSADFEANLSRHQLTSADFS